ncbi:MAG: hypothetical protein ABF820_12595, partial [Sporolactobacillus sp.]
LFSNKSAYHEYLKHQNQLNFSDKTFRNLLNNGKSTGIGLGHFSILQALAFNINPAGKPANHY